jgi:hypothetical protein
MPLPAIDPSRKLLPAGTMCAFQRATGRPSISARIAAPATAMTVSNLNCSVGPVNVSSSAAAFGGLPTSRLASRNARLSIGPEGGTPTLQYPSRPG